jgi:hypothetical protein
MDVNKSTSGSKKTMKTKLFAAALAALTLGVSLPAAAQNFDQGRRDSGYRDSDFRGNRDGDFRRGGDERWRRAQITIRNNGREIRINRDDRLFYRLIDRPYGFRPGLTYAYTDRCNRYGCVAFVFDQYHRRPIDRIFAPHLPMPNYAWRQARGFNGAYRGFGRYDHDDRGWNNNDDRNYRDGRDGRGRDNDWNYDDDRRGRDGQRLEGGPSQR